MNLRIVSPHLQMSPSLAQYIERRFGPLARHFDRESCDLHVDLETPVGESKHRFLECRARLTVPGGVLLARKRGKDPYLAIDAAGRALRRELDEWRARRWTTSRHPKKYYVARLAGEGRLPLEVPIFGPPLPLPHRPVRRVPDALALMQSRRSIRRFRNLPLADDTVSLLADALVCAPSAGNLHSRRFFFVRQPRLRHGLAEAALGQDWAAAAPLLVVCCADLEAVSRYGERGRTVFAPMDVAASIQNLLLCAHALGLGAVWIGSIDEAHVSRLLDLEPSLRPLAIVAVGSPAEQPETPPRPAMEQIVRVL